MHTLVTVLASLCLVLYAAASALAQQRLFVVGGGKRPAEGVAKFVAWSGGTKGRILVITWATGSPEESFQGMKKELDQYHVSVEHAPDPPFDARKKTEFIAQVKKATAIFFGGGDQNKIMDVLADKDLLSLLRKRYDEGVAFGGTSAGAAVLSDPMMTGEADLKILDGGKVGVRQGLGLMPGVIFDQHFLVRQRHNRLFGLMMKKQKMLGIGIDENNAVLIEDNRRLTVVGTTWVMFVDPRKENEFNVAFGRPGSRYDLKKRRLLP